MTAKDLNYTIGYQVIPRGDVAMISKIVHFFTTDVFFLRLRDLGPFRAFCVRCFRVAAVAVRGFLKDDCPMRASALTYYSLLSVVPVTAMAFGIAKGFGLQKLIDKQIIQIAEKANLPEDIVAKIMAFSDSMLETAKGGLIAGVGFILLCWAVIKIIGRIEQSFNHIWEVKKPRSLIRKFTDYIAIVLFTPVLLVVSSSATVVVSSKIEVILHRIELLGVLSPFIFLTLRLLPYVSLWVMLMLNYMIIPNTKVPVGSALLAGVVTGTIFHIVQFIYIKFQVGVAHYGAIYGSFAVLPLFIAWVQVSWMIVLFGAEIAVAYEQRDTFGLRVDFRDLSIASKKLLVLRVFHLMVKRFAGGEPALSPTQIADHLEIPVSFVKKVLDDLVSVRLAVETTETVNREFTYQLARTIEKITIQDLLNTYEQSGLTAVPRGAPEYNEKILKYLEEIGATACSVPANVLVRDL